MSFSFVIFFGIKSQKKNDFVTTDICRIFCRWMSQGRFNMTLPLFEEDVTLASEVDVSSYQNKMKKFKELEETALAGGKFAISLARLV